MLNKCQCRNIGGQVLKVIDFSVDLFMNKGQNPVQNLSHVIDFRGI